MSTSEEARAALRAITRLMEEHGPAADKALHLVMQGALVGPAGTELYNSLLEQRDLVRNAFTAAFLTVQRMAREDARPVPQLPDLRTATAPPRSSVRGRIGGDPELLTALANELRAAGGDLKDAGQALASTLLRIGLGGTPGGDIGRAGQWIHDQHSQVLRRRDELLKQPAQPELPATSTEGLEGHGEDSGDDGNILTDVVNAAASVGNAVLHHPEDVALAAAGAALMAASVGGEAGGLALDATGVGAVAGVPLNIISAAGIAAGATMTGAAMAEIGKNAAGENRVEAVSSGGSGPPQASGYSPGDVTRVRQHLGRLDHSGANDEMLERIGKALEEGRPLTEGQTNFMRHEMAEAKLMDQGVSYEEAHAAALKTHPPGRNYDPDIIDKYPEFGPWWRKMNGLGPRRDPD
ncbi:hypothetical protein AB0K16_17725 [Nonomuraea jabiensis]|uniref:hypothetical protein n=1 Tax=Nonomuraea jabiensis TaxID=882448 RepID=UPI003436E932